MIGASCGYLAIISKESFRRSPKLFGQSLYRLYDRVRTTEVPMLQWATNRWHSIWHVGLTARSGGALLFAVASVVIATALRIGLGRISPDSAVFAPYYS